MRLHQLIYTRGESYRVIIKRHDKIYNMILDQSANREIFCLRSGQNFLSLFSQKIFTQRTLFPRNWTGTCSEADRIFEFISPLNGFYPTRGIFQNEFAILSRESVCERRHSVINNRQAGARCQNQTCKATAASVTGAYVPAVTSRHYQQVKFRNRVLGSVCGKASSYGLFAS